MNLDRFLGRLDRDLGRGQFGHGGLFGVRAALVAQPGGAVDHEPGHIDLGGHVRQLELNRLVRGQRLAKGLAFLGVPERHVQTRLGQRQAERGDRNPAALQGLEKGPEAGAVLAQQILARHPHVLKHLLAGIDRMPADLLVRLADRIAGRVFGNDDSPVGPLAVAARAVRSQRHQPIAQRRAGVGDKTLCAVDDPRVALQA